MATRFARRRCWRRAPRVLLHGRAPDQGRGWPLLRCGLRPARRAPPEVIHQPLKTVRYCLPPPAPGRPFSAQTRPWWLCQPPLAGCPGLARPVHDDRCHRSLAGPQVAATPTSSATIGTMNSADRIGPPLISAAAAAATPASSKELVQQMN